jgi:putative transposase
MKAGKYYIAITYEKTNRRDPQCGIGKVGLDLGIKTPVMLWDGTNSYAHQLPEAIKRAEKHTEKVNQRLSKTTKGSNRHNKILLQLQKAYAHEANVKKDWRDKFVRDLVEDYSQINLDDFGFEGTLNLKNTHRALYRVGVYAFKLALEYKAAEYGTILNYVKKFTPTSKTCSACGFVHKGLKLDDRTYVCPECGLILDRDLNAAINTYNYC